jgi:NTE family protein
MRGRLKTKVGLALGGGAARGMAHIGVLRAFEREKLPVDVVTGTSMGAIIGGAYFALGDAAALEERVRNLLASEEFKKNKLSFLQESRAEHKGMFFSMANFIRKGVLFGVSNLRPGFISAEAFAGNLAAIIPDVLIEDLPLPFCAVTLDINSAEEVLLRRGGLRRAATASSAIPGIIPPVEVGGRVLIDGGWVDKIPVLPAFILGADVVIAIDITAELETDLVYERGVDIMIRANSIKDAALVENARRTADIVIEPAVKSVHWADFTDFERCIEAGDEAATRKIPEIKELLRRERWLSPLRPGKGRKLADMQLKAALRRFYME